MLINQKENFLPLEKIAIAPMIEWTDRHFRYFMRLISSKVTLYTEMIVADAIIHGKVSELLSYSNNEPPIAVQLAGANPKKLKQAAIICQDYGYDEINFNVGCPSQRVQDGSFGACLMSKPQLVVDCIKAMQDAVALPITIKHRLGLNYVYDFNYLLEFVTILHEAGCKKFIVHARNAILQGLSPKENRTKPPLCYEFVYELKRLLPQLTIMLNGGVTSISEIDNHLSQVDSVMLGREAYYNPYLFADFDNRYYNLKQNMPSRKEIAYNMRPYLELMLSKGKKIHHITRHMLGLYYNTPQAKFWRTQLANLTQSLDPTDSLSRYLRLMELMDE